MNHDSSQSNSISCVRGGSVGVTENLVACDYLSPRVAAGRTCEGARERDIYLYRANEAPYLMESPVLDMGHGRSI